jgi:hypothetical protein
MVERAKLDPTIDEIVVALRETTRGASRMPHFTLVSEGSWPLGGASDGSKGGPSSVVGRHNRGGSTNIRDLRDNEVERLLNENARHNERVMYLLKIIEREQAYNAELAAERAAIETDREAIIRDVRTAIETELRPVLLVVLGLVKKQRAEPAAGDSARCDETEVARLAASVAALSSCVAALGGQGEAPVLKAVEATPPYLKLRHRAARVLGALRG